MDQKGIANVLRKHVAKRYGSQKVAAATWKVVPSFVSAVLRGDKRPTKEMLAEIGYECVPYTPAFVKIKPAAKDQQ